MNFLSDVNYLSVIVAAVVSMAIGAAWYGGLGKQWMAAAGLKPEDIEQRASLYIISAICQLIIAVVLFGVIFHVGTFSVYAGILTGFLLWLGFVVPTMTVNHRFQGHGWDLTVIDGGHWLVVLVVQGLILGWMGA